MVSDLAQQPLVLNNHSTLMTNVQYYKYKISNVSYFTTNRSKIIIKIITNALSELHNALSELHNALSELHNALNELQTL